MKNFIKNILSFMTLVQKPVNFNFYNRKFNFYNLSFLAAFLFTPMSFIVIFITMFGINEPDVFAKQMDSNSRIYFKNITHTKNLLEIKPRFVENGRSVLFLVFSGDYLSPKPWDYRLSKSDREGLTTSYLTTKGVLDYNVLSDDQGILVLKVNPTLKINNADYDLNDEIQGWELWYINLQGDEKVLLEASKVLPLSVGYYMLGLGVLPNINFDEFVISSPKKTSQFIVRRYKKREFSYFFKFYHLNTLGKEEVFFKTEARNSYSDWTYWPIITWLDENNFITLSFKSNVDSQVAKGKGLFSLVKVDLQSMSQEILYEDFSFRPFPRFVLNPTATKLFFQRLGEEKDTTELWSLTLDTKIPKMIYKVKGELGEVRFSLDGSSVVFTQRQENNFDIIRVDLDRNKIQKLAGE
ncbi:MAG: hypothetical protein ACE5JB_03845 [bacterium]